MVMPVGWLEREEKSEVDTVEPVAGGEADRAELRKDELVEREGRVLLAVVALGFTPVENDDAMLDMKEEVGAPVGFDATPFCVAVGEVVLGWVCPDELPPNPIAISIMVGCFGSGGGVAVGMPNGFLEPVWCVFTICGCSVTLASGTDAARAGALGLGFPGSCAKGDATCCVLANDGKGLEGAPVG